MKEVLLTKISIENFKGIRHFSLDLSSMLTDIHGNNGVGKTSLYDAYLWLLTGKDSKGTEAFKVQPVDENNVTIPKLKTVVECVFAIDGIAITLKRELTQKWSKPKGTNQEVLKGNVTDYFVDNVPMSASAFSNKIKELFCDQEKIRLISSVFQFFSLPIKDARQLLIQMAGEMPDILTKEEYPRLYDEVIVTKSVDGVKQKTLFARKKDEEIRVGIPLRIDENERKRPLHDFKSLKAEANSIERRMAEIDGTLQRRADSTLFDSCVELKKSLANVESMLEDCERSFRKNAADAEGRYRIAMDEQNRLKFTIEADLDATIRKKTTIVKEIEEYDKELTNCRKEWMETNSMEFKDDIESVCPTCGRAFDEGDIAEMRNESIKRFNVAKVEKLRTIGEKGNKYSKAKLEAEQSLAETQSRIDELELNKKHILSKLYDITDKMNALPTIGDLRAMSNEYAKLIAQKASLKEQIEFEVEKGKKSIDDFKLEDEKLSLQARLKDVIRMLADESRIAEIDHRRKELEDEAIEVASRIAEHDALLYEIQQYGKKRINAVEDKVSSNFRLVKFQMYERNLTNDGEKEICEPLVDGVPYSGNLNYAKKINAGIDVVNAISKWLGISMPLFIDNKESVFNTIESVSQVITLTADKNCDKLVAM